MAYIGGKGGAGTYQRIINLMPPHRVYIEAFLGDGAIMRMKRPAASSIGIDSDDHVADLWRGYPDPNFNLITGDAIAFLAAYDWRGDELVYCDPPYLMETRKCQRNYYRCEMGSQEEHRRLLAVIGRIPARVLISGYGSALYDQELKYWNRISFEVTTRGGFVASERVWFNYPPSLELHDYRYLGRNFRERERIKRRQKRWRARLERMPDLERFALLSVIQDLADRTSPDPAVSAVGRLENKRSADHLPDPDNG